MMSQRNPYEPPSAPIADPPARPGRRIGWKIYLWVMTGLNVAALASVETIRLLGFLDIGLMVATYVGLWGYAYRRRVLTRRLWAPVLALDMCWEFALGLVLQPQGLVYLPVDVQTQIPAWVELSLTAVMLAPLYAGLALYAMRSPEIWATEA